MEAFERGSFWIYINFWTVSVLCLIVLRFFMCRNTLFSGFNKSLINKRLSITVFSAIMVKNVGFVHTLGWLQVHSEFKVFVDYRVKLFKWLSDFFLLHQVWLALNLRIFGLFQLSRLKVVWIMLLIFKCWFWQELTTVHAQHSIVVKASIFIEHARIKWFKLEAVVSALNMRQTFVDTTRAVQVRVRINMQW